MKYYEKLGYLQKRISWTKAPQWACPPELFDEKTYKVVESSRRKYNPHDYRQSTLIKVEEKHYFRAPVFTATLEPVFENYRVRNKKTREYETVGQQVSHFVVKGTDWQVFLSEQAQKELLAQLCLDHRRHIRGDGGVRVTLTYAYQDSTYGCRLLRPDDKIIQIKDKKTKDNEELVTE